jgi:hypothetical protein
LHLKGKHFLRLKAYFQTIDGIKRKHVCWTLSRR